MQGASLYHSLGMVHPQPPNDSSGLYAWFKYSESIYTELGNLLDVAMSKEQRAHSLLCPVGEVSKY